MSGAFYICMPVLRQREVRCGGHRGPAVVYTGGTSARIYIHVWPGSFTHLSPRVVHNVNCQMHDSIQYTYLYVYR